MAKKLLDPKAKAKKQKKIAIGGMVLLLALVAYQGPKTLKLLNPGPPPSSSPVPAPGTTTTPVAPGATPTPVIPVGGSSPASALPPSAADGLVVNADLSPVPLDGQLAALTQFTSKDPFKPQLTTTTPVDGSGPKTPTGTTSSGATPTPGTTGSFTPGSSGSKPSSPGPSTPKPTPTVATISVNGVEMAVYSQDRLPRRRALLPARLVDRDDGEDRDRGRFAGDRLAVGDPEEGQGGDADEHRRRHPLHPRARLHGRHDDARRRVDRRNHDDTDDGHEYVDDADDRRRPRPASRPEGGSRTPPRDRARSPRAARARPAHRRGAATRTRRAGACASSPGRPSRS